MLGTRSSQCKRGAGNLGSPTAVLQQLPEVPTAMCL